MKLLMAVAIATVASSISANADAFDDYKRTAMAGTPDAVFSRTSDSVSFSYENFRRSSTGALEIVLKFKNDTNRNVSFAQAECAFLDAKDRAVTTENVIVQDVSAGGYAYGKNYVMEPGSAEKADCRITAVDY